MSTRQLPGVSIAVSVDDSMVWSEGFGYADVAEKKPVTTGTRFRIGSVVKLMTATAAARLWQYGFLALDAPISTYIDSLPMHIAPITIRQLLGHRSGIRHYGRNEFINRTPYPTVTDALSIFVHDSLRFEPGTQYGYSSYGYVLASAVIEKIVRRNFLDIMHDSLTRPLSMAATMPDRNVMTDTNQAVPYSLDSASRFVRGPDNDNSNRWGAGGWISTPEDLIRFAGAVFGSKYISAEILKSVTTSQRIAEGSETIVGIGWRIGKDTDGVPFYYHTGDSIGGRAVLLVYPRKNVIVAMASNRTFAGFGEREALQIAAMFGR